MIDFTPLKLKYISNHISRGDAPTYVERDGIPVINQGCVSPSGLNFDKVKFHDPLDASRIDSWLHAGDVLINSTGTGTLGRVGYVEVEPDPPIFADGHVTVIRDSHGRFFPKYLFYWLSVRQEEITTFCAEGATNQIELSRYQLSNLRIDWPTQEEQKRISVYLDAVTSKLYGLITTKQRLLNLLAEKRRALITQAVTKGLNSSATMKDSGIPWLGNIPVHWAIERSKWLLKERDERSELGEEELLTVSHLTGVTSRAEKDVNMFMAESLEGYKCCKRGDLVINTLWAWMGAMGVARQEGIVSPAYHVYEPGPNIDPDYLDYLVRMPVFTEEVTRYSKGVWSSRLRLYPEGLYEVWLPVPPIEEQQAIVAHLKAETAKLSNLATATERTIKLLQERRAALISAAVTGQLDIPAELAKVEAHHED